MKLLIVLLIFNMGCTTIATNSKGDQLKIRGYGKAKFENGEEIEGKPMVEFPPINYEK